MGKIFKNSIEYAGGGMSLPAGGAAGQVLAKRSNADGDVQWGDYATTQQLEAKVDKVEGKGLSTNDYTDTEKAKLAGINPSTYERVLQPAEIDDDGGTIDTIALATGKFYYCPYAPLGRMTFLLPDVPFGAVASIVLRFQTTSAPSIIFEPSEGVDCSLATTESFSIQPNKYHEVNLFAAPGPINTMWVIAGAIFSDPVLHEGGGVPFDPEPEEED